MPVAPQSRICEQIFASRIVYGISTQLRDFAPLAAVHNLQNFPIIYFNGYWRRILRKYKIRKNFNSNFKAALGFDWTKPVGLLQSDGKYLDMKKATVKISRNHRSEKNPQSIRIFWEFSTICSNFVRSLKLQSGTGRKSV